MSSLQTGPDLLSLTSFLRDRGRQLLFLSLLLAGIIWLVTRPKNPPASSRVVSRATYMSYASLLLPPNRQFELRKVNISRGASELDTWLSDDSLFQRFLDKQHIYDKVEKKLRPKHPELAMMARSCSIVPAQVGGARTNSLMAGKPPELRGLDPYAETDKQREFDYAMMESNDDSQVRRRFNRIVVRAYAGSPEDSQMLVTATLSVLKHELGEVAVRRARNERRTVENFIVTGARKVERAERKLAVRAELEPDNLNQQRSRLDELGAQRRRLQAECTDLETSIRSEFGISAFRTSDNPVQQALQVLESQARQGELTYTTTSRALTELREKLVQLRAFARMVDDQNSEARVASLRAKLQAKRSILAQVEQEFQALQTRQPGEKARRDFVRQERELATWEAELLAWRQQLLRARITERLSAGDGTAIVLQPPLPGSPVPITEGDFFRTYRRPLALMPLAPLLALLLIITFQVIQEARRVRSRAPYYLDAPVLGELPQLPGEYRRQWQQRKLQG
jgi:hypothetical protein